MRPAIHANDTYLACIYTALGCMEDTAREREMVLAIERGAQPLVVHTMWTDQKLRERYYELLRRADLSWAD